MRTPRGTSGGDPSRGERADAAARRLALLAADLGAADPGPPEEPWPPDPGEFTRVVPARRAVPPPAPQPAPQPAPEPAAGAVRAGPVPPPPVPRPGRHASRRRRRWVPPGLARPELPGVRWPGLGAPQLTVLAVIAAVGVALAAWWVVRDQAAPVAPAAAHPATSVQPLVAGTPDGERSTATAGGSVTVDVTGKVRRPGIVVLDPGARVVDALEAAGGERAGVDLSTLNLARVLVDGEQIVVGAAQATVPALPTGAPPVGGPTTLVNLNTAAQAELETLPDVGPVTALAIVSWRDEHGGFTSVDELLEVDGIGAVTLEKLTPYVTV